MSRASGGWFRLLAVGGVLTGAVCGALFFWSWESPLALLPVTPLFVVGAGGLLVALVGAVATPAAAKPTLGAASALLLMLALWIAAASADLAAERIQGWRHTSQKISATLTDCRIEGSVSSDSGSTEHDTCVYHWTFDGRERTQRRESDSVEKDGYRVGLWMNPDTGEVAEHNSTAIAAYAVIAFVTGLFALIGGLIRLAVAFSPAPATRYERP